MQTNQNQIALLVSLSVCATLFACAQDDSSALSREATSEDRANGTLELVWVDGQSEVMPGVLVFDSASQSFECASDGLEMSCFELN